LNRLPLVLTSRIHPHALALSPNRAGSSARDCHSATSCRVPTTTSTNSITSSGTLTQRLQGYGSSPCNSTVPSGVCRDVRNTTCPQRSRQDGQPADAGKITCSSRSSRPRNFRIALLGILARLHHAPHDFEDLLGDLPTFDARERCAFTTDYRSVGLLHGATNPQATAAVAAGRAALNRQEALQSAQASANSSGGQVTPRVDRIRGRPSAWRACGTERW
jgi:hypothetical protein